MSANILETSPACSELSPPDHRGELLLDSGRFLASIRDMEEARRILHEASEDLAKTQGALVPKTRASLDPSWTSPKQAFPRLCGAMIALSAWDALIAVLPEDYLQVLRHVLGASVIHLGTLQREANDSQLRISRKRTRPFQWWAGHRRHLRIAAS
jgi:hypothetical protein